jgi:hypothetical protein
MNYYELLNVEPTAQLDDIRDSYKKLVLKIHPDKALVHTVPASPGTSIDSPGSVDGNGKRKEKRNVS